MNITDVQLAALLEVMYQEYGYDFRQYAQAHIRRRVYNRVTLAGISDWEELKRKLAEDRQFASQLIQDFSITVTEMFRDPEFYRTLRELVIPVLKTYSFIRVWHAGCSTGEEVYSLAILLKEEGLYERCTLYATDFNQAAIDKAREGIYPLEAVREYSSNYKKAGGLKSLPDYYTADSNHVIMNQGLQKNIVWANHNLVTDGVFAEVHLILCRNVLIYFNRELQNKVHHLFHGSLVNGGMLCLGSKESLRFADHEPNYTGLETRQRIFKKKYGTDTP